MNIADFLLLGIILLFIIIGGLRGLIMSIYGLASTILSYFLAFRFAEPLKEILSGSSFYLNIYEKVEKLIESLTPNLGSIEESLGTTIAALPFPENIKDLFSGGMDFSALDSKNDAIISLSKQVTGFLMTIIIGVVLFIIFWIIFKLLRGLVKKISELPIIKQVDSVAGAVVGIASGILTVYIIFLIISGLQTMEVMNVIHDLIQKSKIASILYNNNFLMNFFS